jgi:hypothetical protein
MLFSNEQQSESKKVVWLFAGVLIAEMILAFALVMLRVQG